MGLVEPDVMRGLQPAGAGTLVFLNSSPFLDLSSAGAPPPLFGVRCFLSSSFLGVVFAAVFLGPALVVPFVSGVRWPLRFLLFFLFGVAAGFLFLFAVVLCFWLCCWLVFALGFGVVAVLPVLSSCLLLPLPLGLSFGAFWSRQCSAGPSFRVSGCICNGPVAIPLVWRV